MKKIILVTLILFCVSLSVFSSEKYEEWDKWDEELPPADSENWQWALIEQAIKHNYSFQGYEEQAPTIVSLGYFYYGAKPFKGKVFVLFYSPEDSDKWKISDSALAIAAFPPKKNKVLVRAYQKDTEGKFKCFDDWTIKYKAKKEKDLVPLESQFSKTLGVWFKSILKFEMKELESDDMSGVIKNILPSIIVKDKTIVYSPWAEFF